eukprot:scaffold3478_cov149-Pinguiococcus_pyrenoidosus.AAC.1
MPVDVTSNFFSIEPRDNQLFDVEVADNVYYSLRLAYRRETPRFFGQDDYPAWLDWDEHVVGHYTAESLSDDGF